MCIFPPYHESSVAGSITIECALLPWPDSDNSNRAMHSESINPAVVFGAGLRLRGHRDWAHSMVQRPLSEFPDFSREVQQCETRIRREQELVQKTSIADDGLGTCDLSVFQWSCISGSCLHFRNLLLRWRFPQTPLFRPGLAQSTIWHLSLF